MTEITHEALEALRIVIEAAEPMRLKEQAECLLGTKHRNPIQKAITQLETLRTGQLILAQSSVKITERQSETLHKALIASFSEFVEPIALAQPSGDEVEAVARALYEEDDPWCKAWPWPNLQPDQASPDAYRRLATAAITAYEALRAKEAGNG